MRDIVYLAGEDWTMLDNGEFVKLSPDNPEMTQTTSQAPNSPQNANSGLTVNDIDEINASI